MSKDCRYIRITALCVVIALFSACTPYIVREQPKNPLPDFKGRIVNLFWPGQKKIQIQLTDVSVSDSLLTGNAAVCEDNHPYNYDNLWVNIYVSNSTPKPQKLPGRLSFPLSGIQRIEMYDVSTGKVVQNILLWTGTELAIMGLIFVSILAFKESCPFVYAWDGENYVLAGETYSGAIFPRMERHDYLPLPQLKVSDSQYRLKLTNEVREIQNTNLTELLVVDHAPGTSVLIDKYGICHAFGHADPVISAITPVGNDITPQLSCRDELRYSGSDTSETSPGVEVIELSFQHPATDGTALLVLHGRSSFWLDYTMKSWFDLFGDRYDKWYRKQCNQKTQMNQNWALEQGIPLKVSILRNRQWQPVDTIPVTGPMADRDLVMPIGLSGIDTDVVKLKLECGFMFWDLDYAGLALPASDTPKVQSVSPTSAVDGAGSDITRLLNGDDALYHVMGAIGDQEMLCFVAPPQPEGMLRSVFLHGKGHYKVLNEPVGKPAIALLKEFRKPGRLGLFAYEKFHQMRLQASNSQ